MGLFLAFAGGAFAGFETAVRGVEGAGLVDGGCGRGGGGSRPGRGARGGSCRALGRWRGAGRRWGGAERRWGGLWRALVARVVGRGGVAGRCAAATAAAAAASAAGGLFFVAWWRGWLRCWSWSGGAGSLVGGGVLLFGSVVELVVGFELAAAATAASASASARGGCGEGVDGGGVAGEGAVDWLIGDSDVFAGGLLVSGVEAVDAAVASVEGADEGAHPCGTVSRGCAAEVAWEPAVGWGGGS